MNISASAPGNNSRRELNEIKTGRKTSTSVDEAPCWQKNKTAGEAAGCRVGPENAGSLPFRAVEKVGPKIRRVADGQIRLVPNPRIRLFNYDHVFPGHDVVQTFDDSFLGTAQYMTWQYEL